MFFKRTKLKLEPKKAQLLKRECLFLGYKITQMVYFPTHRNLKQSKTFRFRKLGNS